MYVPILRETIGLTNLAAIPVAVGPVLSFHKRRVDFVADLRQLQRRHHSRHSPKDNAEVNLHHPPLPARLVDGRVPQPGRRFIVRCLGPARLSRPLRHRLITIGFQDRPAVRLVFIAGYEVHRSVTGPLLEIRHQRLDLLDRPLARHHADHQAMLGIDGHMVPVVSLPSVVGVGRIAAFFLLAHKRPLFVELNLACIGGKRPRVRRGVGGRGRRPTDCNASPYLDAHPANGRFCERRSLPRYAPARRGLFPQVGSRRTAAYPFARKTVPCRFGSGAFASACSARSGRKPIGFRPRVFRNPGTQYSDNKTATDHP